MRRALGVDEVLISNLVPSPTTPDYKLKVVVKPGDQYLSRGGALSQRVPLQITSRTASTRNVT